MGDKNRGLYNKFDVFRLDVRDRPGEKHHGCQYFVLDLTHDPFAIPAIRSYANACQQDYPVLARDLYERSGATVDPGTVMRLLGMEERAFREKDLNDPAFHAACQVIVRMLMGV